MNLKLVIWFLSLLCGLSLSTRAQDNLLKIDLAGLPIYLFSDYGPYPRASLEFEHRLAKHPKVSWIADFEVAREEESYFGMFGGTIVETGNIQKSISLIGGLRYYLFRVEEKNFFNIFFVEPRIAASAIFAKLIPYTVSDPFEYTSGVSVRPRVRTGIAVPLTRHLGLEGSADFSLYKFLGSGRNAFYTVFEFNFVVAF